MNQRATLSPSLAASTASTASGASPATMPADLGQHFNASHLRHDTWDAVRQSAERLARRSGGNGGNGSSTGDEVHLARIARSFELLRPMERYWVFPGTHRLQQLETLFAEQNFDGLARAAARLSRILESGSYRRELSVENDEADLTTDDPTFADPGLTASSDSRPYFEVLVVDELTAEEQRVVRSRLLAERDENDPFVYDLVFVPTLEDGLIAALFNYNIQSCVVRYSFPIRSANRLDALHAYVAAAGAGDLDSIDESESSLALGHLLRRVRPELDLFLVTDAPVEEIAGSGRLPFQRVFYRQEDYRELHSSLLKGVGDRYRTPFFSALKRYSQRPTGVFHAMPLSRGKSIDRSHWIGDMAKFYGHKIFQAETSATTGGLDSLLQPHGTLREAQDLAARAFGAKRTFFVTNGTSAANKIVSHALLRPGDIALVARDCHKSHHYSMQVTGAEPVYLDSYPLSEYSFYGAVRLADIKARLFELEKAGKLDRVRMLLLTNCTFDGLTYNPERVMEEVLAIKPDMIFLWDEAWFAFATFHPTLRPRTAMASARRLRDRFRSPAYREEYRQWKEAREKLPPSENRGAAERDVDERRLDERLLPDPELATMRVYATQSTHKTLTALRQGSMIHIFDEDFEQKSAESFSSAYMTYTSTSPNYQILASLDIGRRQVELEGYELVQRSIELAMLLRKRIESHPLLLKYFRVLKPADMIPKDLRPSGLAEYFDPERGWSRMEEAWESDEIALDPTRITLHVGRTGMDGDTFKNHLMDAHDIQINKTSRNTVLFMIHIGTSRGAVAHLIEVLCRIAQEHEDRNEDLNPAERALQERRVRNLNENLPPLPSFSRFHPSFGDPASGTREGDLRRASFLAYEPNHCEYLLLDGSIERELASGRDVVSAGFITPYPPGFPVLVPGQVISPEILAYLRAVDVKEIHGYRPEYGLRVFREEALASTHSSER